MSITIIIENYSFDKSKLLKYICLTSLTRAKPKEKMEFPALFLHYA